MGQEQESINVAELAASLEYDRLENEQTQIAMRVVRSLRDLVQEGCDVTPSLSISRRTMAILINDVVVWDNEVHGWKDLKVSFCIEQYVEYCRTCFKAFSQAETGDGS